MLRNPDADVKVRMNYDASAKGVTAMPYEAKLKPNAKAAAAEMADRGRVSTPISDSDRVFVRELVQTLEETHRQFMEDAGTMHFSSLHDKNLIL